MKQNNKGYSLVEIIIVIAILAILSTVAYNNFSYIKYANTKTCAKEINSQYEKARQLAMSKPERPDYYIYKYNDNIYLKLISSSVAPVLDNTGTLIGNGGIDVYYTTTSNPTKIKLNNGDNIKIQFKKSSGGLKPITASEFYNQIIVCTEGSTTGETIHLVEVTGKHYMD